MSASAITAILCPERYGYFAGTSIFFWYSKFCPRPPIRYGTAHPGSAAPIRRALTSMRRLERARTSSPARSDGVIAAPCG
jgi:hypothetical protein